MATSSSVFRPLCLCLSLLASASAFGAGAGAPFAAARDVPAANPVLLTHRWPAEWIAPAGVPLTEYGVFLFRHRFALTTVPARFVVHLSADNRYRLFVNGTSVCFGPQRGDLPHWHFDSVDLAPYLRAGDNVIAVQVWNFGEGHPAAIMSRRTGLIVQGDGAAEQVVNTDSHWRVQADVAFTPLPPAGERLHTYIVVGPGSQLDAAAHPWGWEKPEFDDAAWVAPRVSGPGLPFGSSTDAQRWLVPRSIPLLPETPQHFATIRRASGVAAPSGRFLAGSEPWTIPAHTSARLLLDQGCETSAFPRLVVSGGRGATVTLAYAEALFDAALNKGNRNDIEGRELVGFEDRFLPDGGVGRSFTTLDYRTYRYVELRVDTGAEPLTVDALDGNATGYPFAENATFTSNDPTLAKIWEVGWRTARLCAAETYTDCPYYERLQYVGDTRIQALISLYVSGDDRLMRNAIVQFDQSRVPEGLTLSRYPSDPPQLIPPFSLLWVGMVHDYWLHRDDPAFVSGRLPGIAGVLAWFAARTDKNTGMLGPLPYWSFVDWPDAWPWKESTGTGGEPPGAREGGTAIVTLQYAMALDQAAELFRANGHEAEAVRYAQNADALRAATLRVCWDANRKLLADTPARTSFSQHANALAVLSGSVRGDAARELMERTLSEKDLVPCTLYFRFYLLRALKLAGLGDRYVEQLAPWRTMLALGLTTFAERPEPTRSDCHGWSASPVYEFLATVCGIEPGSPGFKTVRIEPHLGPLHQVEGTVPHPAGPIHVHFTATPDHLRGRIELPGSLTGELLWHGHRLTLKPGVQEFEF